jgi:hypothetical protein
MWLSLLISVAYVPGITGAAIPTGWAAMSFALPWVMLKDVKMTSAHYLGLVFIAYAAASLAWTTSPLDGVDELWHWAVIGLAFMWGSRQVLLTPFWKGLAIGCGISSAVALSQWLSYDFITTLDWNKPAGLFYNNAVAGSAAAIAIVGCMSVGLFRWALLPVPLLLISQSRGAWAAIAVVWIAKVYTSFEGLERIVFTIVLAVAIGLAIVFFHGESDSLRLTIWQQVIEHLTVFGRGIGASQNVYLVTPHDFFHIEHAHNDYLNLLYEYGLGAFPLFILAALLLEHSDAYAWPAFVCCLFLSLYFWTLETPITSFTFAVVAGHVAASPSVAWRDSYFGRYSRLPRQAKPQPPTDAAGRLNVSV